MSLPDQTPKLPKLPFLIGDALLLAVAWFIVYQTHGPLSHNAIAAVSACVAIGALLGVVPFLTDYARKQDEALDDRQRGLEALSRTVNTAAEQISIAANGLAEITELLHRNLKHAEQLPQKLQEKIAEFTAQLENTREDDREEMEKEIAELRASESDRLQGITAKIHQAVAELNKLDATAQKNLSARKELAESTNATVDTARTQATQAASEAIAAIQTATASAEQALAAAVAAQATVLGEKLNASVQTAMTNAQQAIAAALQAQSAAAKAVTAEQIKAIEAAASTAAQAAADAISKAVAFSSPDVNATVESAPTPPAGAGEVGSEDLRSGTSLTAPAEAAGATHEAPIHPKRARKSRREESVPAVPAAAASEQAAVESAPEAPAAPTAESAPEPEAPVQVGTAPEALPTVSDSPAAATSDAPFAAVKMNPPVEPAISEPADPVAAPFAEPAPASEPAPALSNTAAIAPIEETPPAAQPEPDPAEKPARKRAPRRHAAESTGELSLDLGDEDSSPGEADDTPVSAADVVERVISSDGATRLIATAYIGIGNRLFIRGDGPGLSWDKGVPLQFVSIGKWRWETADATAPISAKLYKNDEIECSALGTLTLDPGYQQEVSAKF